MKYEKGTTQRGVVYLLFGIACFLAPIACQLFLFNQFSVPTAIIVLFWVFGLFACLLVTRQAIKLIKNRGKWIINIDQNGIDWQSPDESVDASYQYSIADIEAVEIRVTRSTLAGSGKTTRKYFIVRTNGKHQRITPTSGLKPQTVADELESMGIPILYTRD